MLVGSGAPNATTTPLSMRAARESRRAAYSAGAMSCPFVLLRAGAERSGGACENSEVATHSSKPEQSGTRMEGITETGGLTDSRFRIYGQYQAPASPAGWHAYPCPATVLP